MATKIIFAGVLFLVSLLIISCNIVGKKYESRSSVGTAVRRLLIFAGFAVTSYGAGMLVPNETAANFLYGLYCILLDCMVMCLARFALRYTEIFPERLRDKMIVFPFLTLDSIFMLINPFKNIAFRCGLVDPGDGNMFYMITKRLPLYYFHLCFVYLSITLVVYCLIKKALMTPKIYRTKYITILIIMAVTGVAHSIYRHIDYIFDFSLIFYAAMAFAIFYFSLVYVPTGLIESLLAFAVTNMADGIICIDIDGKCVHANKAAKTMYRVENSGVDELYGEWASAHDLESDELNWNEVHEMQGGTKYYIVRYKRLCDIRNSYLGCFFIIHDNTEEKLALEAQKYRATHDMLTGIFNREYFYECAKKRMEENPDKVFYIVCTDIKNFKMVNDLFGVEKGNQVLRSVAKEFSKRTTSASLYGRLSGDRFAMCVPKEKFLPEEVISGAKYIMEHSLTGNFRVQVYVGVYEVTDPSLKVSVMCDRALLAIKTISGSYRETIAYYDENMRESFLKEQNILTEFESALAEGQFRMYIQPQVDSETEQVMGGEALVRWISPKRGLIPPYEFIDIFERSGLICRLDKYMWETACKTLKRWKDAGREEYISVNISPKDFYHTDIYEEFTGLVKKYGIDPGKIKLEITETAIMSDLNSQLALISWLREYGFAVEIDDFGSGYSSLNTLKDMNVDVLKIDMGFLRETANKKRSRTILENIITLSKELHMEVVCEGVETVEQVNFLREAGCDTFQGYYFAKPMPLSEFEERYFAN